MKIQLLAILVVGLALTSCKKTVFKRTTVAIDTENTVLRMNLMDEAIYLAPYENNEAALLQSFRYSFSNRMGKGKIDMVSIDESPDFIVAVDELVYVERWNPDYDIRRDFHQIDLRVEVTLKDPESTVLSNCTIRTTAADKEVKETDENGGVSYREFYTGLGRLHCQSVESTRDDLVIQIKKHQ